MTPACEKIFTGGGQYGPPVLMCSNISSRAWPAKISKSRRREFRNWTPSGCRNPPPLLHRSPDRHRRELPPPRRRGTSTPPARLHAAAEGLRSAAASRRRQQLPRRAGNPPTRRRRDLAGTLRGRPCTPATAELRSEAAPIGVAAAAMCAAARAPLQRRRRCLLGLAGRLAFFF